MPSARFDDFFVYQRQYGEVKFGLIKMVLAICTISWRRLTVIYDIKSIGSIKFALSGTGQPTWPQVYDYEILATKNFGLNTIHIEENLSYT